MSFITNYIFPNPIDKLLEQTNALAKAGNTPITPTAGATNAALGAISSSQQQTISKPSVTAPTTTSSSSSSSSTAPAASLKTPTAPTLASTSSIATPSTSSFSTTTATSSPVTTDDKKDNSCSQRAQASAGKMWKWAVAQIPTRTELYYHTAIFGAGTLAVVHKTPAVVAGAVFTAAVTTVKYVNHMLEQHVKKIKEDEKANLNDLLEKYIDRKNQALKTIDSANSKIEKLMSEKQQHTGVFSNNETEIQKIDIQIKSLQATIAKADTVVFELHTRYHAVTEMIAALQPRPSKKEESKDKN